MDIIFKSSTVIQYRNTINKPQIDYVRYQKSYLEIELRGINIVWFVRYWVYLKHSSKFNWNSNFYAGVECQ